MMEMRFNITTSEYGVSEFQIQQIVCAAINNMVWYFIEMTVIVNLIFFFIVMGCMYFCKPRLHKQKLTVEEEREIPDVTIKEVNTTEWEPVTTLVADAAYEGFEAPPSYDELINQPTTISLSNDNSACPSYVFIKLNP